MSCLNCDDAIIFKAGRKILIFLSIVQYLIDDSVLSCPVATHEIKRNSRCPSITQTYYAPSVKPVSLHRMLSRTILPSTVPHRTPQDILWVELLVGLTLFRRKFEDRNRIRQDEMICDEMIDVDGRQD